MSKKAILVITDGIGHNKSNHHNAFAAANKPTYDYLFNNAATTLLKTSGESVGLPDGQMGNSEVGHMTIGAGRVLYQNLVQINKSIKNEDFKRSDVLNLLFNSCKRIHIVGLYSDGGVHSLDEHFLHICNLAADAGCEVFAHPITDGRDVLPDSAVDFISKLENRVRIATISGRFYAMDRDKRFDRVQKAYDTMVKGENPQNISPSQYIKNRYENGEYDEFITPASFNGFDGIKKDDGIIFINFRNDRMKQIVQAFGSEDFNKFDRPYVVKNIVTMTEYDSNFSYPVLIEKQNLQNTLSQVIANAGLRQFHTAETEKYAHVTFFFNGGVEEPVANETRFLVPSPKVATYDEMPQMSADKVCDAVLRAMNDGYDFIVVNFANGDMVGHTGNFDACVKAVEAVDECLGRIVVSAQRLGYAYMQISDHGNCEQLMDDAGNRLTNHTTFDVYCFVFGQGVTQLKDGKGLSNVAPSVLKLMGLDIPIQMDEPLF